VVVLLLTVVVKPDEKGRPAEEKEIISGHAFSSTRLVCTMSTRRCWCRRQE